MSDRLEELLIELIEELRMERKKKKEKKAKKKNRKRYTSGKSTYEDGRLVKKGSSPTHSGASHYCAPGYCDRYD